MIPQISILIPVFNAGKFIEATIESVRNQTFQDWELIVLDDASTDRSFEICKKLADKDSRIKVYRNDSNLGMVANWNKGIKLCKSRYFVKLDADDLWRNDMLEKSYALMEMHPEVALMFTSYVNIDLDSHVIPKTEIQLPDFAKNKTFSCVPLVKLGSSKMLQYPILRQGLSLFRRELFESIGDYRYLKTKETEASSDTEFYFRVGCHHLIYCLDEVCYFYRVHIQSISATDAASGLSEKKMYEVKNAINDYYLEQGMISGKEWKANYHEIKFRYVLFEQFRHRTNENYWDLVQSLFVLLFRFPTKTITHLLSR